MNFNWWLVGILVYLLPTIIALFGWKECKGAIFFCNFFFGWTGIGWILVMLWACLATSEGGDWWDGGWSGYSASKVKTNEMAMKFVCKKCGQHYSVPNAAWYGKDLICNKCDNYMVVPTPWFEKYGGAVFIGVFFLIVAIAAIYQAQHGK